MLKKSFLSAATAIMLVAANSVFADDAGGDLDIKPGVKVITTVPVYVGAGSLSAAVNTLTNRVYISNLSGNNVSVLDGDTNKIIHSISVGNPALGNQGFNGPSASAIDEASNTIYTINNNGILTVIDGRTNKIKKEFTVDSGSNVTTQDMVFSHKTGKLYVVNAGIQIDVIDPKTEKVLSVIPNDNATFLAINQRTNKIYVSQYWDGSVWVIDGDTDQVVDVIDGVGDPAVPDNCYLSTSPVPCTDQSSGLDHLAVDELDNRLYVVGTLDGRFVTIDTKTNTVLNIEYPGNNQNELYNVAVNPLSHTVYTISDFADILSVINGKTDKILSTNTSIGSPLTDTSAGSLAQGITVNPKTGKIYVVDYGDIFNPPASSSIVVLKATETDDK